MKKLYFLIAAILAATGLCAQTQAPVVVNPLTEPGVNAPVLENQVKSDALADGETQLVSPNASLGLALRSTASKGKGILKAPASARQHVARALSDVLGSYISDDKSYYDDDENHHVITIYQSHDSLLVKNLMGTQNAVVATYDATTGIFSIAPQLLYNHSTYGECWIYGWSGTPSNYSSSQPVTMTVDADGNIEMSAWGLYVNEGDKKGSIFDAYTQSVLYQPNATMHTVTYKTKSESTYPVLVQQPNTNTLKVINFTGNGRAIKVTLKPDSTCYIGSQYVATYDVYGDFNLCAASSGSISKYKYITGTKTDSGYSFSPWGVFCMRSTSIATNNVTSSELTFKQFTPSYPAQVAPAFAGSGTEADPYRITSLADLDTLAQAVNAGKSYKDVYFKQTANIDASATKSQNFAHIGFDESSYFDGTYDGDNKTISNFNYDAAGDNYAGLFGIIGANAVVKNVVMTGSVVKSSGKYAGTVVGYNNGGAVTHCTVTSGKLDGRVVSLGGIVGYSAGPISHCAFTGNATGGAEVGGIVGQGKDSITDCHASADIEVDYYIPNLSHGAGVIAGDLIGSSSKKWVVVERCYSAGSVYDSQNVSYVGGIAGGMYMTKISQSFNTASITCASGQVSGGTAQGAGGIAGYLSDGEIDDCYNAGAVNAPANNESSGLIGYAGGYTGSASTIHNSYSSGMLENYTTCEYKGVLGSYFNQSILDVQNAYYDYQSSGLDTVSIGFKSTTQLTSGEPLSGFDTTVWYFKKGFYPRLRAIMDNETARLSAAPMFLQNGENGHKEKSNFTLSTADGITWGVYKNGEAVKNGTGITVDGGNVTLTGTYGYDHLLAINSDNEYKYYDIYAVTKAYSGSGTEADPYLIKTKADLEMLADAVNVYKQNHRGDYFKMTNDIDLELDKNFTGIAAQTGTTFFNGTFDGGNHTVHQLYLDPNNGKKKYTGLFGLCGAASTIKNVRVAADSKVNAYRYGAAVVGYTEGKVINCRNYANVDAYDVYTGGVVGVLVGTTAVADSCYNSGTISSGQGTAGGVVGYSTGLVQRSRNDGEVNNALEGTATNAMLGGVVGSNLGVVENVLNTGTVLGNKQVGGIVGVNSQQRSTGDGGYLMGNVNTGIVRGNTYVGAIAGQVMSRKTIADNLYDAQLNPGGAANGGALNGAQGRLTTQLTAGKELLASNGKEPSAWTWTAGSYPALKAFADETVAATVDHLVLKLDTLDNVDAVTGAASLSSATWSLASGKAFAVSGSLLKVTQPADTTVTDTLTAVVGSVTRHYPLRAVPAIFAGRGTQTDPYQIKTVADMYRLANAVEKYDMDFDHHYFKVMNDIDFTDTTYVPVATGEHRFQAYFDGNGKSFKGVKYSTATMSTVGLFGNVGPDATIANLTIESGQFTAVGNVGAFAGQGAGTFVNLTNKADVVATSGGYAAGIVASAVEGSQFVNCRNQGTISLDARNYVGGITAYGEYTSYENCQNDGLIMTVTGYAGGISGASRAPITNCRNTADITSNKVANYLAGITGLEGGGSYITGCVNTGNVTMGASYVGGIVGSGLNEQGDNISYLHDCVNYGDIEAQRYAAGIMGQQRAGHNVAGCFNYGKVTVSKGYGAGIVGYAYVGKDFVSHIDSCYNYGAVTNTSTSSYMGGILAYGSGTETVTGCANWGNIVSKGDMVGGVTGSFDGTVSRCYNAAPVKGIKRGIAGITAFGSDVVIDQCFNLDSITATGTAASYGMAAGILGYGTRPVITNCYNMGSVTAVNNAGGIMGSYYNGYRIENCYNAAPVAVTGTATAVAGNIAMKPGEADEDHVISNCYYNSKAGNVYSSDSCATGVDSVALTLANLGEAFVSRTAMYPTLQAFADTAVSNYFASIIVLADGDTPEAVRSPFSYGSANQAIWTSSDNLYFDDGKVYSTAQGPAWVTKSYGKWSYTWHLNVTALTGVDATKASKTIAGRCYYDLYGRRVADPGAGVYIEVTRYTDGSTAASKVVR